MPTRAVGFNPADDAISQNVKLKAQVPAKYESYHLSCDDPSLCTVIQAGEQ